MRPKNNRMKSASGNKPMAHFIETLIINFNGTSFNAVKKSFSLLMISPFYIFAHNVELSDECH